MASTSMNRKEEDGSEDESSEQGYSSLEENELERNLADIPLGELQKVRADGSQSIAQRRLGQGTRGKRTNKNRPMEISSKAPVKRLREVIQAPKKEVRDPRFESLCGSLDTDGFRKRYGFLFEVELPSEKKKLQAMVRKSKDPSTRNELQQHIDWIDKQLKSAPSKNHDAEILSQHKKKEREAAKQGKRPFYLKKSDIRERKLVQKYNELKASGKLDAFLEKKRKRNASKDARLLPFRRNLSSSAE
ncbi:rRNA biogenesis RRP36-like protein [Wolffia australiana]